MFLKPVSLSPARKLAALRARDIFHQWDSIDEERFCRRCGEIITGRTIKVVPGRRGLEDLRLECPTEGCPSVPIEWIVIEQPDFARDGHNGHNGHDRHEGPNGTPQRDRRAEK
ncbi:MAG: hypothetical protein ACR2MW_05560 [Chthoniobacterales bacterium]